MGVDLNMETLILHPTAIAQWHALIKDASLSSSIKLPEDLESYLVFLLMRFAENPNIAQSILALDFLHSLEKLGKERLENLRDVGDKCLLFAGLFPGRARKRRVRISYFVKLGQSAYASLSESNLHHQKELSLLFSELCLHFVGLMDILQATRELEEKEASLDPIQAEELWSDTKSQHALQTLQRITKGIPIGYTIPSPLQKH